MNTTSGTPISWPLRIWLLIEVLFGVGAVLSIGLSPGDTKTNFAWPIQAVVMAALLGGFYITSAPLFLVPLFARRWESIRAMILPAALFTALQLLVTVLHWDKFSVGTFPFYVWFASYLLPPPIFLWAYVWQQRRTGNRIAPATAPLPAWLRTTMLILGSSLAAGAALVFVFPSLLIPVAPWPFTPLTARSMCAWLIAVGALLLSMVRENDRARVRLATPMLFLLLPVLLMQMLRYTEQVNWGNPVLWLGLVALGLIGACGLYLAKGSWAASLRG